MIPFYRYYQETSGYIKSGTFKWEPDLGDPNFLFDNWTDYHAQVCLSSSAYKEMPIKTPEDGTSTLYSFEDDKNVTINKYIVTQGVPTSFRAKTHGGLTKLLADSYYFWNFGDGIRYFSKKEHDEWVTHRFYKLGKSYLTSIVLSEEIRVGISIGGSFGPYYNPANQGFFPIGGGIR